MRVATWNVNSLRVRLPHLLRWLDESGVDIVALQETKVQDGEFPASQIQAAGYECLYRGQKTYNGVALLSRGRGADVVTELPGAADPERRVLGATYGRLRVLNLYVPNGASVGSEKYRYKLDWFDRLNTYLAELCCSDAPLLVLGDFNVAPEDRDVHDPAVWAGQVLVSEPERECLRRLMALGFCDLFRKFEQPPASYSWWDYRQGAFRRNHGLRIDLILANPQTAARCRACVVDRAPRTWEQPSDHAPVVADFDFDTSDTAPG